MKDITRVFIIAGMILGGWLIFPLIVGCVVLSKFENAKDIKELKIISIICLLFCSLVGGILMLSLTNEELRSDNVNNNSKIVNNKKETINKIDCLCELHQNSLINDEEFAKFKREIYGGTYMSELSDKLNELTKLHENGTITDNEFKAAKEKLVSEYIKSNTSSENSNYDQLKEDENAKIKGFWLGFFLTFIAGLIGLIICLLTGDNECKRGSKIAFFINLGISVFFIIIYVIILLNHGVIY